MLNEIGEWLRQSIQVPQQGVLDDALLMYMTITMILGASVVGTQLQQMLKLDDVSFKKLRPKAIEVLRQGMVKDLEKTGAEDPTKGASPSR